MMQRASLGLLTLVTTAALLAGCASTPPEDPAVANLPRVRLSGAEMQGLIKERRFSTRRMNTDVLLDFRDNGSVWAAAPNFNMRPLEGKWRFEGNDQFCVEFSHWMFSSESGCFWVERRQDGAFFTVSVRDPSNVQRVNPGQIQAIQNH